ncbi:MAG: hypothetical protein PHC34_03055 [Candidatus Gastranaerophilales bacterium]|nr:hypothetical protein [Candidatus Gastranaerophilales bacterium]
MFYNIFKIYTIFIIFIFIFGQPVFSSQNDLTNLNTLETQLFSQNFSNESLTNRLDRVERVIFGKTYSESENNRINRLAAFAHNPKKPIKSKNNNINTHEDSTGFAADSVGYIPKDDSVTDYPVITMLESSAFEKDFRGENVYLRLNRLESKIFGTTFPQDSLYSRVDKLKSALNVTRAGDSNGRSIQGNMNTASIFANLSSLELTVFNQTYDGETTPNRLSRLENKVFGSIQSGTPGSRLSKLNQNIESSFASSSPNNDYNYGNLGGMNENYSNTTTPSTSGGAKSAAWQIIKSLLFNFLSGGYSNYGGYGGYNGYGSGYNGYNDPYSSFSRSTNNNMGAGVHILP